MPGVIPSSIGEVLAELKHVNEEIKKNLNEQAFTELGKNKPESAVKATDAEIESHT
ncbi:MAG: hypothetical protein MZU97_07615 [Bacillus subtilis]|nr:hypothetical protein [Bacillus subtilis]